MKLTAFFLCIGLVQVSASGLSQTITFSGKNVSISTVFAEIEKQTGYLVVSSYQLLEKAKPITIVANNEPVTNFIKTILVDQPFNYSIENRTIFISKKTLTAESEKGLSPALSQEIKGRVMNESGEPLFNASVQQKGTNNFTVTNENGYFSLTVTSDSRIALVVSFVGMETQELSVDNKKEWKIVLKTSNLSLSDIVVIGYGSSRKKDLTGSVASVDIKDQEKTPVISTEQLLEGKVSGVQVTQSQSQPGGAVFSLRIRGTNSINSGNEPLYVVDGYAGGDIIALSPSDITSISVLKDASATAIYGSRGANGVVIITTKRGAANSRNLTIDAYTGVQQVGKKYKMMDAKQFATYLNTVQTQFNELNGTTDPLPYSTAEINQLGSGVNWQDAIFRRAPVSNIAVGLNGGNKDSRYFASFSYFDQQGIVIGSDYKKGILRFNVDHDISTKVKSGFSSYISYDYQNVPSVNTDGGITSPGVLWDAVRFNPSIPVKDSAGEYTYQNGPLPYVGPLGNPVAYALESKNNLYIFRGFANAFVEYEMIRGLKLRSSIGASYDNTGSKSFTPSTLFAGAPTVGAAGQNSSQNYNWLSENTLSFANTFNKIHSVSAVGGFTFQHWYYKGFATGITNLSNNNLGYDNLGIGVPNIPFSYFDEHVLTSFFGRVNYGLMNKYLFTFTARSDGSSRFGDNHKWGFFPSGAFAWNIAEEKFMKNISRVNELKLRLSYGVTGNQEIGDYISLPVYINNIYSLGRDPSPVTGISPVQIANPEIKWEQTASADIGLDIGLFSNRIQITTDYYHKKTSNLLLFINVPSTTGYSTVLRNIGAVQNKGFELSVTTHNVNNSSFKWTSTLNFSTNNNKILNLGADKEIFVGGLSGNIFLGGGTSSILRVGEPIGSFYGNEFGGIWQSQSDIDKSGTQQPVIPGDPIYKDLDGDSILSGMDRAIIGRALPKFIYSFTNNFTFGRFSLNIFLQGIYGNNIFNENRYEIENGYPIFNKLASVADNSWDGPGSRHTLPSVISTYRRGAGISSEMIENGSFLRLKTLTLSYQIPLSKHSAVFKNASVYVTAQNLATFTNYSGYDPEVNSFNTLNQLSLGTDYNAYPNYRSYLLGVKFSF